MRQGFELIISDASCLILLDKINEIALLKLIGDTVLITPEVKREFHKQLPDWVQVKNVENVQYQKILEYELGAGEASSIALGLELKNSVLIIDELKGRKIAERLSLKYSGTFGLILKAKQMGLVKEVKPIIDKILETNFRISNQIITAVLQAADEIN